MRILHIVTRSEFGGAQSVVRTLAESQAAAGHDAAVAAGPEGAWEAFRGMDERVAAFPLPDLLRAISPRREFKALHSIAALERSWAPDIVHLHTSKAGALGRLAPGIPRRRIVYTMHGYDQIRVENRTMLGIDALLRPLCGAIVAVSSRDAEAMGKDGYDVEYIPNGVPDPSRHPAGGGAAERISGLEEIRRSALPLVIVVAREARPKRIDIARSVAQRLRGCIQVAWIGGQPRPDDPDNFHALGAAPDAAALFAHADIFFLPSDHEGMPLAVLEAMAAGLPIVASATGGVPEMLQADAAGRSRCGFALPNEVAEIADAFSLLAADAGLREKMGEAARQTWAERYSAEIMAAAYENLYRKLLFG
ncbi:glycosyltransferase family 4 protein [bacterium]|nr:glycosyltransferase family 4 protein [bacterium]